MLKTPQLKSIFLAILPGLLVALFVFSANIYYDLDLGKVMLTGIQKIIGQLQTTATTTLAVLEGGVGIATESPEYKLDVQGSARFGAGPTDPIVFQGYIQSGIVPYHNNYYLLGNENYRWSNLYTQEINVSATSTLAGTLLFKRDNYFYTINIPSLSANRTLNLPSEGDVTLVSGTMVPTSRTISTTAPLTGGGDLSTDRTISISGLSSLGTANYIVGVNSSETGWEYKQLSGESGEIDITHGTGSITIGIVDPLAVSKGGTGISSYTTGDILYASGATTLSKLGIGANGTILSSSGSAPEWVTLSSLSILTGSGTQNTIAKFTGTYSLGDSIISDDGSLVSVSGQLTTTGTTTLATTGGNVGIGTSNPSSFKLQVAGNVGPDSDNAYDLGSSDLRWRSLFLGGGSINVDQIGGTNFERLTIKYDTTNNTFLLQTTQGGTGTLRPLQITTGSNTGVFIDQTGKIGISTTTPSYTLDISGSLGVSQNLYLSSTSLIYIAGDSGQSGKFLKRTATGLEWSEPLATVPWPLRAPAGSEGTASAPAYSFELYTSTGMFLATSTQALAFSVAGNQVLTLATTTNVGIGTTAPGRKLDILDSANPQTRLSYSSSIYGELKVDSAGNLNISTNPTGKDIIVSDNNMRVCSGGSCPSPYYSGSGNFQVEGTAEIDTKLKLIAVPSGVSGSYTWNLNALEVCQFGTCCPPWKDCDGDGRTYGAGTDCDEGCSSCYVGSTNGSSTPDGKDQDCDGQVDEQGTYYVKILNSASSLTCNTVCANNGGMCTSIGTDSEGTNGRLWAIDEYHRCVQVLGGCGTVLRPGGGDCEGYASEWTMCRCGVDGYQ
ncbi:hypothetical protein H5T58_00120 [Candidatus Parcubacteria bacterium]|nr:hypothetical protein [Candidatus Parcubacteria bacterium]